MYQRHGYQKRYHGGGGGGYPSKRVGGGGGGGGRSGGPRPTEDLEPLVLTNQNRLRLTSNDISDLSDYVLCDVKIENAYFRKDRDEATGERTGEETFVVRESTEVSKERFYKTRLPWRVMKSWANEFKFEVAYDGGRKAYFPSAASSPEYGKQYRVKIKRDCEEDDLDAEYVRECWFAVSFHEDKCIPIEQVSKALSGDSPYASEEISAMFNIILKSDAVMTRGMISLKQDSPMVFFPRNRQPDLLDRPMSPETRDGTKVLLSGLKMTAVFVKGGACVQTESIVQYANKDYIRMFQVRSGDPRVPLLDVRNQTIAGVRIDSLSRPVSASKHNMIEEAIGKRGVTVEYYSKKLRKDGRPKGKVLFMNKSVRADKDETSGGLGKKIIWSAEDPNEFTFDYNDQKTTVAQYYQSEHDVTLKYPQMPLLYVDNISRKGGGWIPIELAFQSFSKSKENSEDMVNEILKYHDVYAGRRYIEDVARKLQELKMTGDDGAKFEERLNKWGLAIENTSIQERAKLLKAPQIIFKNSNAHAINGGFNLRDVKFSRPSKLTSFAVANFAPRKDRSCYEYVQTVMRVAQAHGIEIPSMTMDICNHDLDLLTEHYSGRAAEDDALEVARQAILRAQDLYLNDRNRKYRDNNAFFQTHCYSEEEREYECVVLPPTNRGESLGLLLDYNKDSKERQYFSHRIETNGGNVYDARLMVKIRETDTFIDPLDFRFHHGRHQASKRGAWVDVTFDHFCYVCPNENEVFQEQDIRHKEFVHLGEDWDVDFPSIVFVYLPDDGKALYNRVKVMSNFFVGKVSQCAVSAKFEGQRSKDQYASNIATKINAKLSTIYDKAVSWTSTCDVARNKEDNLIWVGELPTLVVGVGLVHGMGRSAKTIVAASLCLDSGCMRLSHSCFIQKRSDKISKFVIKDIIKVAIEHYEMENKLKPERILFYRDGMSDGSFSNAEGEIDSIRQAAAEKLGHSSVPITFVICQTQQLGFRMVPANPTFDRRGKPVNNVSSGTVLECGDNSFYLVPQGGLKGTSKPVKYIVHLNESEALSNGSIGLTLPNLMNLTNQMSWKYPTATKAVREVPVIKYAKRLANQVLSSLPILQEGCNWFGTGTRGMRIRLVCPEDESGTEEEMRPYLETTQNTKETAHQRQYNLCQMPYRNHLAA